MRRYRRVGRAHRQIRQPQEGQDVALLPHQLPCHGPLPHQRGASSLIIRVRVRACMQVLWFCSRKALSVVARCSTLLLSLPTATLLSLSPPPLTSHTYPPLSPPSSSLYPPLPSSLSPFTPPPLSTHAHPGLQQVCLLACAPCALLTFCVCCVAHVYLAASHPRVETPTGSGQASGGGAHEDCRRAQVRASLSAFSCIRMLV